MHAGQEPPIEARILKELTDVQTSLIVGFSALTRYLIASPASGAQRTLDNVVGLIHPSGTRELVAPHQRF